MSSLRPLVESCLEDSLEKRKCFCFSSKFSKAGSQIYEQDDSSLESTVHTYRHADKRGKEAHEEVNNGYSGCWDEEPLLFPTMHSFIVFFFFLTF